MHFITYFLLSFFAVLISFEDMKSHRIRNNYLLCFFSLLSVANILVGKLQDQLFSGSLMFFIFTIFYAVTLSFPKKATMGFGDIKLISVISFGYFEPTFRTFELFFLLLWLGLLIHICVLLISQRQIVTRIPMAPSIFLAAGLYLFTPIALLLPQ